MRLYAHQSGSGLDDRLGVLVDGGLLSGGRLAPHSGPYRLQTFQSACCLITDGDWQRPFERTVKRAIKAGVQPRPVADRRPRPAIQHPEKIVCVGLNYGEHAREGGREAPPRPLLFAKFANTIVGDGDPVIRPRGSHALDLEVELGVVIGRVATRVAVADAMDHVAGYVVLNDISARDWQGSKPALRPGETGDGQWLRAKGSDTFLPIGPVFVTADELDPRAGLRLRSWRITADGSEHLMQDSTTADMIFDIPALIAFISNAITLLPGDVIATGTPSGVGVFRDPPVFLEPGDRVRCEIDGIGTVENPIVDADDRAAGIQA
jgi:2-keto-4-pentenoate hydratase/2-oxohepta-3-ene-1,7-dioic acid hydratase in catechol pathway